MLRTSICLSVLLVIITSCASFYRQVKPYKQDYNASQMGNSINDSSVTFEYVSDVLSKNPSYYKKGAREGIEVISYKLVNNTNRALIIGTDLVFSNQQMEMLEPLTPMELYMEGGHQIPGAYAFYFTAIFTDISVNGNNFHGIFPVGIPIGLANILVAGRANIKYRKELNYYDLYHAYIEPGKTYYGIAAFKNVPSDEILLRYAN